MPRRTQHNILDRFVSQLAGLIWVSRGHPNAPQQLIPGLQFIGAAYAVRWRHERAMGSVVHHVMDSVHRLNTASRHRHGGLHNRTPGHDRACSQCPRAQRRLRQHTGPALPTTQGAVLVVR